MNILEQDHFQERLMSSPTPRNLFLGAGDDIITRT
jgi:hypothetical protein